MSDGRIEAVAGGLMDSRYGWNREYSILEAGHLESCRRDAKAALAAVDRYERERLAVPDTALGRCPVMLQCHRETGHEGGHEAREATDG